MQSYHAEFEAALENTPEFFQRPEWKELEGFEGIARNWKDSKGLQGIGGIRRDRKDLEGSEGF